jgi:hypothetical protein
VVLVGDGGAQGKLLLTAIRNIHIYWNRVQRRCLDWDSEAVRTINIYGDYRQ